MTRQEITAFYAKHYKRLYNSSYRIVGNGADAEEIMHDTILKFLEMEVPPQDDFQISAWLIRTCIRKSIDKVRRQKRTNLFLEDYEENTKTLGSKVSGLKGETADAQKERQIVMKAEKVKEALGRMADPYRVILTLMLIEGYDYQEITEITMQKEATIRSQFSRGKTKLLELLQQENVNY